MLAAGVTVADGTGNAGGAARSQPADTPTTVRMLPMASVVRRIGSTLAVDRISLAEPGNKSVADGFAALALSSLVPHGKTGAAVYLAVQITLRDNVSGVTVDAVMRRDDRIDGAAQLAAATAAGARTAIKAVVFVVSTRDTGYVLKRVMFIRAVNVGGAKLPMAELRELATDLGATDVSTYIASGNLLCTPPGKPANFDRALEAAIKDKYGFFREVISRTPAQLQAALDKHPFEIVEDRFSYVYFLTGKPTNKATKDFHAMEFGGDEFTVIGEDLHIRYCDGAGKSDLDAQAH